MARNPWTAAALSLLFAGLGQLYVGAVGKALAFAALEIVTAYVYLEVNELAGMVLNLAVGVVSVIDAYSSARRARKDVDGRQEYKVEQPEVRVF